MKRTRDYSLLLTSQFFSAFGDNAVLAVIVGQLTYLQQDGSISSAQLRTISTVFTSLLFVPYVLLAPLAGYLNDRYSKASWLAGGNALKLLGTAICGASTLVGGSIGEAVGYFVVGVGACAYGPAKYGILPEILPREQLVRANGMVELLTLLAILTGAIGGAALSDALHARPIVAFGIVATIYGLAWLISLAIRRQPGDATVTLEESVGAFGGHLRELFSQARLRSVLVGTALFWFCGAVMKINFQPWGLQTLGFTSNTAIALLGLWLSVGVMIGSVMAGRIHSVGDLRGTPFYGIGLAGVLALLFCVKPAPIWLEPTFALGPIHVPVPVVGVLILAGIAAGLFLIPLNAALQAESDPNKLGKTIAVQNLSDNLGMCLAGGYTFLATVSRVSASGVFMGLAVILGLATIYMATQTRRRAGAVAAAGRTIGARSR
jgi:LPLT family lysophospholipid transporter-like MFS transporter